MAMGKAIRWSIACTVAGAAILGPGASRAHAYIDPGTGSSLLSSLGFVLGAVCTVIALGFAQIKHVGRVIVAKLSARRNKQTQENHSG